MASVNITTAAVGQVGKELISLMKLGNEAFEQGSVYVVPGVGKELFIPRLNAADDQLQARVETPTTGNDSLTYDERSIATKFLMWYDTFNPNKWQDAWEQFFPNGMQVDTIDNPDIQAAILREILKTVGKQLGKLVWQGDIGGSAELDFFDGFVTIATADAGTIKVTPAGAITEANVISVLESVEAAIPSSIWSDPEVVFQMNTGDARKYLAAARALDFKGSNISDAMEMRFAGRQIRHTDGMKANSILAVKSTADSTSNLWAGVWANGDEENVKIARLQANSELFFAKVLMKMAVNFANAEEVVIYNPA
jgi:hypothetical protein